MDWDSIGLSTMAFGLALYAIFFNLIIEGIDSGIELIVEGLERISTSFTCVTCRAFRAIIRSRHFRIIQILLFTTLLLAFSSELFAYQKAPFPGLLL